MRERKTWVILFLILGSVLLSHVSLTYSTTPRRSIENLPSANGLNLVNFNLKTGTVDRFLPHISDIWDVGYKTPNLIKKLDCKIIIRGKEIDLSRLPIAHAGYVNGTGIIRIEYATEKLKLVSYIWAPMIMEQKAVVMAIHVTNLGDLELLPEDIRPYAVAKSRRLEWVRNEAFEKEGFWVGQVLLMTSGWSKETVSELKKELAGAKPNLLLEAEERWWMHWHRLSSVPSHIIEKKYHVLKQSAAFIKMAQCREPGPSRGQIVNSLSTISGNVAKVRDMAYAIVALSRMGYIEEARQGLEFILNAGSGQFESLKTKGMQWGMGEPYLVSLSYYAGLGFEKADFIGGYPILHFDGQGLFLWAFAEYMKNSTDISFARRHWIMIKTLVITPLLRSIDDEGLMRRDSGWWNLLPPGEHFTYTSLCAFKGLNSAATIANTLGYDDLATLYMKKAAELRANILTKLTVGKALVMARSLESKKFPYFLDGTSVEAINWSVVDPFWKTAQSISKAMEAFLRIQNGDRGFARSYRDEKAKMPESPFVTLRAVNALRLLGEKKKANRILNWMIEESSRNAEMIPEFIDNATAAYVGRYPLVGLGAGAYILAVLGS